jgi:signal transduction histidine kinase
VVERSAALVFAGVRGGPQLRLDPSLDGLRLRCDQDRLVQILVNLLQNAHDALRAQPESARGAGSIAVSAQQEPSGEVCIAVEDDGPGIDARIQDRLFEPFTTTKPPGEGTGLGLYTSYMLARSMHGSLALEPRAHGGTRALVRLPLDTHGPVSPAAPAASLERAS